MGGGGGGPAAGIGGGGGGATDALRCCGSGCWYVGTLGGVSCRCTVGGERAAAGIGGSSGGNGREGGFGLLSSEPMSMTDMVALRGSGAAAGGGGWLVGDDCCMTDPVSVALRCGDVALSGEAICCRPLLGDEMLLLKSRRCRPCKFISDSGSFGRAGELTLLEF